MSENCNNQCSSCSEDCAERSESSLLAALHKDAKVHKVIAVVSGKGGVGKSMITSQLAVLSQRSGKSTAVLDADITGPSIPMSFGLHEKAVGMEHALLPSVTKTGIKVMSLNLLTDNESDPVVWRGPLVAGLVKQFWSDVIWGEIDQMFVDCPPGTGDVPLTVFQSLPIDGIIIVTSPQDLVSMIVAKAVKMAQVMKVPVLGIVENMAYFECPTCQTKHNIFGDSKLEEIAAEYGIKNIARLPIETKLVAAADKGEIEDFEGDWLNGIADAIAEIKK